MCVYLELCLKFKSNNDMYVCVCCMANKNECQQMDANKLMQQKSTLPRVGARRWLWKMVIVRLYRVSERADDLNKKKVLSITQCVRAGICFFNVIVRLSRVSERPENVENKHDCSTSRVRAGRRFWTNKKMFDDSSCPIGQIILNNSWFVVSPVRPSVRTNGCQKLYLLL